MSPVFGGGTSYNWLPDVSVVLSYSISHLCPIDMPNIGVVDET